MKKIIACVMVVLMAIMPLAFAEDADELDSMDEILESVEFGDKGDMVKQAQACLIRMGFLQGVADGLFGNDTKKAVEAYQESIGAEVSGIVTMDLLNAMQEAADSMTDEEAAKTLNANQIIAEISSKGDTVKEIQSKLSKLGFLNDFPDGRYGAGTAAAVKAFQESQNLSVTGTVNGATYELLKELSRATEIVSLFAFVNVFNSAELVAGTDEYMQMPEVPAGGGETVCNLDEYTTVTLTLNEQGNITKIVVDGEMDGFADSEASILNAFNAALTGCGKVNTLDQGKEFLKNMGAYGDVLSEDGIGTYSDGEIKYDWFGENGKVQLCISLL